MHRAVLDGRLSWSAGVPRWVLLHRLCTTLLEDGPNALQLFEGSFTEVVWHMTFALVIKIACCCNDLVLGCDIRIGDVLVFVEHRGQYSRGSDVFNPYYP